MCVCRATHANSDDTVLGLSQQMSDDWFSRYVISDRPAQLVPIPHDAGRGVHTVVLQRTDGQAFQRLQSTYEDVFGHTQGESSILF